MNVALTIEQIKWMSKAGFHKEAIDENRSKLKDLLQYNQSVHTNNSISLINQVLSERTQAAAADAAAAADGDRGEFDLRAVLLRPALSRAGRSARPTGNPRRARHSAGRHDRGADHRGTHG